MQEQQTYIEQLQNMGTQDPPLSEKSLQTLSEKVQKIRQLKKEKNAVILSHFYMPAELQITHDQGGIADFTADSLGLSVAASETKADYIVFCGVKFMAETAKIINRDKTVLLPSFEAGCSLAASITAQDVRNIKAKYPGVPVMTYINTYAETKAESDVCCTSRNAMKIAKSFTEDQIIFLPDVYMGRNLQKKIKEEAGKDLILWDGKCEVHEQFTKENISLIQDAHPSAEVLVHWEVPEDAVDQSLSRSKGIVGSTGDILNYVGHSSADQFILGSECDLGATLKGMYPNKEFISPCIYCPHMKQITIDNTLDALLSIGTEKESQFAVELDPTILEKAYHPIARMLELS